MTEGIKIPVSAQLNTADAQKAADQLAQQINAMGQRIAQANKVQFNPVGPKTIEDLKKVAAQYASLLKVHNDLAKRMKNTGQSGAGFFDADWSKMYSDPGIAARKQRQAFEYVTGGTFNSPAPTGNATPQPGRPGGGPAPSGGGGGRQPPGPVGRVLGGAAQSGLRAMGPAGGVAAGAVGTGMSAGFGAGLMGLVGGVVALGVGKAVSAVMERMESAEKNAVDYDKLKRVIGDVGVSFGVLKTVVQASADNLKITYSEAAKLGTEFAKISNASSAQYKDIGKEVTAGVGLSRSFGLDPSAGVGVLGQMRNIGVTKNVEDSRKFAVLIGETIGKSNTFAKADEVMSALASFATTANRSGVQANVKGYAGTFAAMAGSGLPGFDVASSTALLSRMNSTMAAGGGHGEASQFFTGSLGAKMGLTPYQTQMWREGGMFSTPNKTFGEGSNHAAYTGKALNFGKQGDMTLAEATRDRIEAQYGRGSDQAIQAMANQTGINMNQAAGYMSLKKGQMGELYAAMGSGMGSLSGNGIANAAKAFSGTAEDRKTLASQYLGRTGNDAISSADRSSLEGAKNDKELKAALLKIVGNYDQERTQGSDIRDSKNLLDNLKTAMADKLIPYTQDIRAGILFMAGKDKGMTGDDVMREIEGQESDARTKGIKGKYGKQVADVVALGEASVKGLHANRVKNGQTMEQMDAAITQTNKDTAGQVGVIRGHETTDLKKEDAYRQSRLDAISGRAAAEQAQAEAIRKAKDNLTPASAGSKPGSFSYGKVSGKGVVPPEISAKLAAADKAHGFPIGTMEALMQQESGGRLAEFLAHPETFHYGLNAKGEHFDKRTGHVSTAFGPYGTLKSTAKDPGMGVAPLKDNSLGELTRFTGDYLEARVKKAGSLRGGLAGYGEGTKYADQVMARIGSQGTELPPALAGQGGGKASGFHLSSDTFKIQMVDAAGNAKSPEMPIQTRIKPAASTTLGTGTWGNV